ncbi:MAG: uracil phosphoribosyltransferase [Acidimicrobiia bacterium]|nr:uracil phosphoribosyltransferase [Acidimicrobiia bacterium]MDH4366037.1 uracil phosphoribosyltransferase [Acidimicrobiia bacterium]
MSTQAPPQLTVVDHPLVAHKITMLRNVNTSSESFRSLCTEITLLTAYEALRHLPVELVEVETPITTTRSPMLSGPAPAVVGILRAGLVMVEAILTLIPHARVGHLGLFRDPETHRPVEYYRKLPADIANREVLLVDPMLATGGSAVHALDILSELGCRPARLLSIIGCPEGVGAVHAAHPEVTVTLAALDEGLNDHAYIVPGLGDAGDRIYGTR